MPDEIIAKKLEQINGLTRELRRLLEMPFNDFGKDPMRVRAAERNFQLMVDLASDINTQMLLERGEKTPDTYKQSFGNLVKAGIIDDSLAKKLVLSAGIRNILVHEYDFEEDYEKFYTSAKEILPAYGEYVKLIHHTITPTD